MKAIKKILSATLLLALMLTLLTACGSENKIVGTWKGDMGFFTFDEDGYFSCDYQDLVVSRGKYSITDSEITLTYTAKNGKEKSATLTVFSLTDDSFSFGSANEQIVLYKQN